MSSPSAKWRIAGLQTEPEFLIDTAAVNRKYAARKDDPRRWWTGVFQADAACLGTALEKKTYESCQRFVDAMRKRNWDLVSGIWVYGPFPAHDIDSSLAISGKNEYRVRGQFRLATPLRTDRIEIPAGLVKRDPEHRITLRDALRAR